MDSEPSHLDFPRRNPDLEDKDVLVLLEQVTTTAESEWHVSNSSPKLGLGSSKIGSCKILPSDEKEIRSAELGAG